MKAQEACRWLMENGGPVIRYRTATELLAPGQALGIQALQDDMLHSPQVQEWLGNLAAPHNLDSDPGKGTGHVRDSVLVQVHGSLPTILENVLGKLTNFGLRCGIRELDQGTLPYRKWLADNPERPTDNVFTKAGREITTAFLARAGYVAEPAIRRHAAYRLNLVYDFTRQGSYDIYVPNKHKGVKPVIKPELTQTDTRLPSIYDIVAWAAYLPKYGTTEELAQAENIIDYIMHDEYQAFPPGYGYMVDVVTKRTWSLGWNVMLPGVNPHCYVKSVVHMMDLLVSFRAARQHAWFKESMALLEGFKTGGGTYLFPRDYLPESQVGRWVCGHHMGLEENRRTNKASEVESTFWMAKLKVSQEAA